MDKVAPFSGQDTKALKHKRRFCKVEGCERIVKSQGLCQRHGAKPRKCKVEGCPKQAQGNFDGMCKSHFKASKANSLAQAAPSQQAKDMEKANPPPPAQGESVYNRIIPESIAWCPRVGGSQMPLVAHIKAGFDAGKPPAWHRNEERRARGLWTVTSPATQLEAWERELVWTEILILTGNSQTSFRHLARAWGRDKGFQTVLAQFICERKGSVERKTKVPPQQQSEHQRSLGQLPTCVEIRHTDNVDMGELDEDQLKEDASSTSTEENTDVAGHEDWEENYYNDSGDSNNDDNNKMNSMNRNEELTADFFMFQPGNRFASFEFDSAMLADAEAIISSDDENENDRKRSAV